MIRRRPRHWPGLRGATRYLGLFALLLASASCSSREETPAGALQEFVRAVERGREEEIYALLAPASREHLAKMAKMATEQSGGLRQLDPEDMLVANLAQPRTGPGEIEELSVSGEQARVKLYSSDRKSSEIFELVRVDGKWRVVLPDAMYSAPPAPEAAPTSRPAAATQPSTSSASGP